MTCIAFRRCPQKNSSINTINLVMTTSMTTQNSPPIPLFIPANVASPDQIISQSQALPCLAMPFRAATDLYLDGKLTPKTPFARTGQPASPDKSYPAQFLYTRMRISSRSSLCRRMHNLEAFRDELGYLLVLVLQQAEHVRHVVPLALRLAARQARRELGGELFRVFFLKVQAC